MPRTGLGRWAGRLLAASVLCLATVIVAYNTSALGVFAQGTGGALVLGVITAACAIGTLVTGLISWVRLKDRSFVVIAATVFGALATVVLIMGSIPQE